MSAVALGGWVGADCGVTFAVGAADDKPLVIVGVVEEVFEFDVPESLTKRRRRVWCLGPGAGALRARRSNSARDKQDRAKGADQAGDCNPDSWKDFSDIVSHDSRRRCQSNRIWIEPLPVFPAKAGN